MHPSAHLYLRVQQCTSARSNVCASIYTQVYSAGSSVIWWFPQTAQLADVLVCLQSLVLCWLYVLHCSCYAGYDYLFVLCWLWLPVHAMLVMIACSGHAGYEYTCSCYASYDYEHTCVWEAHITVSGAAANVSQTATNVDIEPSHNQHGLNRQCIARTGVSNIGSTYSQHSTKLWRHTSTSASWAVCGNHQITDEPAEYTCVYMDAHTLLRALVHCWTRKYKWALGCIYLVDMQRPGIRRDPRCYAVTLTETGLSWVADSCKAVFTVLKR